jgi:UDP-glucose-4-epimerase GalE
MTEATTDASRSTRRARQAVLVTGGAGYIGSHTCKALARAGYLPVCYDNLVHGHRSAVRWGPFVAGDLADADLLAQTLSDYAISAVVHFAGYCYVGESMTQPYKYFHNNTANSLALLEAMRAADVRTLVFSSTCATYGMPESVPMSEDTPQRPINPYGESKLFVEKMMRWWENAHGLKWMALRYFNAAGADPEGEIGEDHTPETHLIPLAIQAALGLRDAIDIYGTDYPTADGTAIRDYIHVADLADAHVRALEKLDEGASSGALNLGTGSGCSVREVIAMVREVAGRDFAIREMARRAGDPPELVADARRAAEVLGWRPQHSGLRSIVQTAWDWHARHQHAATAAPRAAHS